MERYDIGIGWVDAVEKAFVERLRKVSKEAGLSLYEITFSNLADDYKRVSKDKLHFKLFIDRASIDNSGFSLLANKLKEQGSKVVNDPEKVIAFSSKVSLVKAFEEAQIPLPKIHIVDQNASSEKLTEVVNDIGTQFAVKPAYGGGINEILLEGKTAKDIEEFIAGKGSEPYLIQEFIKPSQTEEKTSWWRIIYAAGLILPFWWDPKTHIYEAIRDSKEEKEIAEKLKKYTKEIAQITDFDLFSTEFAIDEKNNELVCIDYANQPIDLNTVDNSPDALPVKAVEKIASEIISLARG